SNRGARHAFGAASAARPVPSAPRGTDPPRSGCGPERPRGAPAKRTLVTSTSRRAGKGARVIAPGRRKIVLLGMMTKIPVAGVVWQTIHYLVGFQRLGFDPYYVEAHARTPGMLMRAEDDDSALIAAGFIRETLSRFGLDGRWAYHALHEDRRLYGIS